jgi:hypothetical protein
VECSPATLGVVINLSNVKRFRGTSVLHAVAAEERAGGEILCGEAHVQPDDRPSPEDRILLPTFLQAPIPEELHSVYEAGPFTRCSVCEQSLVDGRLYEVQKVYRGKEVIFEMGICHGCGESIAKDFSEESLEAMKGFLLCNFKPTMHSHHCHFCGSPRSLFPGYTIVGACRERSLIFPSIVMCEKCSEGLQERLSRKTREVQGDFIRDHFPGVPANLDFNPSLSNLF